MNLLFLYLYFYIIMPSINCDQSSLDFDVQEFTKNNCTQCLETDCLKYCSNLNISDQCYYCYDCDRCWHEQQWHLLTITQISIFILFGFGILGLVVIYCKICRRRIRKGIVAPSMACERDHLRTAKSATLLRFSWPLAMILRLFMRLSTTERTCRKLRHHIRKRQNYKKGLQCRRGVQRRRELQRRKGLVTPTSYLRFSTLLGICNIFVSCLILCLYIHVNKTLFCSFFLLSLRRST